MEHFHQIVQYLAEHFIQNNHILFKADYNDVTTQLYWGSFAVVVVVNIVVVVEVNVVVVALIVVTDHIIFSSCQWMLIWDS